MDSITYPELMTSEQIFEYISGMHYDKRHLRNAWNTTGMIYERVQVFEEYKLVELNIFDLNADVWDVDKERVSRYIEATKENPNYPPIVFNQLLKRITDGTHRTRALTIMGFKTIRGYIGVEETHRVWEDPNRIIGVED